MAENAPKTPNKGHRFIEMILKLCEDADAKPSVGTRFILNLDKSLIRKKSWLDNGKLRIVIVLC